MTVIKPGDLVMLKSGGPAMTVDTVNTDIFDDDKITGVLCVWFVGTKLERVRFDHRAIEPVRLQETDPVKKAAHPEEATGEYKTVLDEMAAAMNVAADQGQDTSNKDASNKVSSKKGTSNKGAAKAAVKQAKPRASRRDVPAALPITDGIGAG